MTDEIKRAKSQLQEILMNWNRRAIGHTQAMVAGCCLYDCVVLVKDERQINDIVSRGVKRKNIITLSSLPESVKGLNKPIVVDHYVLTDLISQALLAERRKAYEECARIAEEAVKGYATTYRGVGLDIANEIRRRMEGV